MRTSKTTRVPAMGLSFIAAALMVVGLSLTGCKTDQGANSNPPTGTTSTANPAPASKSNSAQKYDNPAMLNPELANDTAPEKFHVKFDTTKGPFIFEINRKQAPRGADRFYNMVKIGYFKDIVIFRSMAGFMFQFGIHGDPAVNDVWNEAKIIDDPGSPLYSNNAGTLTFATSGPDSRTVQMFVNFDDNAPLDAQGFTPIGKIVEGGPVAQTINTEYGNAPSAGRGQMLFQTKGNSYILGKFPNLDVIKSVTFVDMGGESAETATPPAGN